jgi:hypothetical protein
MPLGLDPIELRIGNEPARDPDGRLSLWGWDGDGWTVGARRRDDLKLVNLLGRVGERSWVQR